MEDYSGIRYILALDMGDGIIVEVATFFVRSNCTAAVLAFNRGMLSPGIRRVIGIERQVDLNGRA